MVKVNVLKAWLDTLDGEDDVAIDEGGIALVEVGGAAYFEVGGEPVEDEEE